MTPESRAALDIARRIADGEPVDSAALEASDPALARGLRKLGLLAKAMHPGGEVGSSWGHLQQLELAGRTYGENTLSSFTALVGLATTLNSQGRFAETKTLLRDILPKTEAVTGTDSSLPLSMRTNLAAALYQSGKVDEALVEYESLIASNERHYGATHPQSLVDRFNRLEALNVAGRYADALREGEALRTVMIETMGAEHLFTLETEDAIGYALNASGKAVDAETVHRRTLARKIQVLGADNPYTLLSREYLARALIAQQHGAQRADVFADRSRARARQDASEDRGHAAVAGGIATTLNLCERSCRSGGGGGGGGRE
jgi:tetratricopeptide (TPR) repeat protein